MTKPQDPLAIEVSLTSIFGPVERELHVFGVAERLTMGVLSIRAIGLGGPATQPCCNIRPSRNG